MRLLLLTFIFMATLFSKELPWDKTLIKGQLENGFKYTIKKNEKPANKAELRLVVKVGSLEEDDDQKGIAHVVEHMAFNGTKHFKGNDLIKFLESIGVEFGSHLNASTSTEVTQYQLSVPLKDDNLEKTFLIFQDWAGDVTFDAKELDKERGVVLEEARSRDNAGFRTYVQALDTIYAGSKYKERIPIGDLDIIRNIKIDRVKAFYDDWYRPEHMHFVAVGDFDVKKIEKLIKKSFSHLKNNSKRQRASRYVPKIDEQRVLFTEDKELTSSSLTYYFIHDYKQTQTIEEYRKELLQTIALKLFNQSNSSLLTKDNPVAQRIGVRANKMGENLKAYTFTSAYQGMKEKAALYELVDSIYTIKKFGFDKYEFDALIKDLIYDNEENYKTLKDTGSSRYASVLGRYAVDDDIFIDEEFEYKFLKNELKNIKIENINKVFSEMIDTPAQIVNYDLATQNRLSKRTIFKTIKKASKNVKKPFIDPNLPKRILTKKLEQKAIKNEVYNKEFDMWELTLANDIKILFKKNSYQRNNVDLYSFSYGGFSLIEDDNIVNAKFAANIIANSGLSDYSYKQLNRIYAGKRVGIKPYISRYSEGFSGSSSSRDFETLLELLYLYHTEYKVNDNILKNTKSISEYRLRQVNRDPKSKFSIDFLKYYYKNNKRYTKETIEDIQNVKKEEILKIYEDRFMDTNNFTYIIVGDIDYKKVKNLASTYLANLPVKQRNESYKDRKIEPLKGQNNFVKYYENKNISTVSLTYLKETPYSLKEAVYLASLKDVLTVKLRELIREEKSGVYGVSVKNSFSRTPKDKASISISFTCDPKRKDELTSYVKKVVDEIQKEEVEKKYINSFIKKRVIAYNENIKTASYWENILKRHAFYNDNISDVNKYIDLYENLTPKDVKNSALKYLTTEDILFTVLNPKSMKN